MDIHIVTLNTKASNNPMEATAWKNAFAFTHAFSPVVFCMQELDINAQRSGQIDVPRKLAGQDPYVFAPTICFAADQTAPVKLNPTATDMWSYGIGTIVHNAEIRNRKIVALGPSEETFWKMSEGKSDLCWECEPRAAILTEVGKGRDSFWVVNTHLAHKSDRSLHSDFRAAQIDILQKAIKETIPSSAPMIITGDFNATPDNPDLAPFHQNFVMAPVNEPTKITKKGDVQVDHMFARSAFLAERPDVIETKFSDHKAVHCHYIV